MELPPFNEDSSVLLKIIQMIEPVDSVHPLPRQKEQFLKLIKIFSDQSEKIHQPTFCFAATPKIYKPPSIRLRGRKFIQAICPFLINFGQAHHVYDVKRSS